MFFRRIKNYCPSTGENRKGYLSFANHKFISMCSLFRYVNEFIISLERILNFIKFLGTLIKSHNLKLQGYFWVVINDLNRYCFEIDYPDFFPCL